MKAFDTRAYSISDFLGWHRRGEIKLQPKFQRRQVWSEKARSYLIDTIIRGKPMPKVFIRQEINPTTMRATREVVDGQQRLTTIFLFVENGFQISKVHNAEYGGMLYSELPDDVRRAFLAYEIATDLLLDAGDQEVLDIFQRLNSYSVTLNTQELLHARYFGDFKQSVYNLSIEFLTFWTKNKIFSDSKIVRMAEAEMTSDLLIAISDGIKSKKAIPSYYQKYDDEFPRRATLEQQFRHTMDVFGEIMGDTLPETNLRRIHIFYTIFCSLYHHLYGLPGLDVERVVIRPTNYPKVRIALDKIDRIFEKDYERSPEENAFLEAARRATTDASVRESRSRYVCQVIVDAIRA